MFGWFSRNKEAPGGVKGQPVRAGIATGSMRPERITARIGRLERAIAAREASYDVRDKFKVAQYRAEITVLRAQELLNAGGSS